MSPMSEHENDVGELLGSAVEVRSRVVCPHCDRTEDFQDDPTARAWLTGHIQAEHSEQLPRFDGTDAESDGDSDE